MSYQYLILVLLTIIYLNNVAGGIITNESETEVIENNVVGDIIKYESTTELNEDTTPKDSSSDENNTTELVSHETVETSNLFVKQISDLQSAVFRVFHTNDVTITYSMIAHREVDDLEKMVSELQNQIKSNQEKSSQNISILDTGCKEYLSESRVYGTDNLHLIDDANFEHITLRKENGSIKYFEMHIAIKSRNGVFILLSGTDKLDKDAEVYEMDIGSPRRDDIQTTFLRTEVNEDFLAEVGKQTPNIISSRAYTVFSIIISDGVLTLTRKGDKLPILTYTDEGVNNVKYFGVASRSFAIVLYDCPVNH